MDQCKCLRMTSHNLGVVILTGHHESCPHSPGVLNASADLIRSLVRGIEGWASQEDGIPDELWDAYAKAKAVIGETVNAANYGH